MWFEGIIEKYKPKKNIIKNRGFIMGADEELYKIARSKAGSSHYETRQAGQKALNALKKMD